MNAYPVRFGFKERVKRDDNGDKVLDDKGQEVKVPAPEPVEIPLPQFDSIEDIAAIAKTSQVETDAQGNKVEKSKQLIALYDALNQIIKDQAKVQVDEAVEEGVDIWPTFEDQKDANGKVFKVKVKDADMSWLDVNKLTWDFIANIPPGKRGKEGIPEEVWDGFISDYVAIMMKNGKNEKQAKTGAAIIRKRFTPARYIPQLLENLKNNLTVWMSQTEKRNDYADLYQTLMKKVEDYLSATSPDVVNSSV